MGAAAGDQKDMILKILSKRQLGCGLVLAMLIFGVAGCPPREPDMRQGRVPGPSKQPPTYPAARNVPLDKSLRNDAQKELVSALRSVDPEVRAHALEGLEKADTPDRDAMIVAALSDQEGLVRYAACLATGQLEIKSAHATLLKLADDHDPAVRVAARYALHRIGDYRHSHELEQLSHDPEAQVRGTTAMVLGMLGDPSALKVLAPMRLDPSPPVRQQAAAAMWQLGSEQGLHDLIGWSVSRFPDDEIMGLTGLAEPRNREVIQHVRAALVSDWPQVNLTAARAMGMLGSDEGYGIALIGAKSVDPAERIAAATALGAIGRSDSQDLLRKLLHDSDANVRIAAAEAILELKVAVGRLPKADWQKPIAENSDSSQRHSANRQCTCPASRENLTDMRYKLG